MTDLCYYSKHFCKACCFYCAQEPLFLVLLLVQQFRNCQFFYLPTGDTTKSLEDQEREDREEEEEEEDEQ
jgi:hypothetical protein